MSELNFVTENSCKLNYRWDWKNYPIREQELFRLSRNYVPTDVNDAWNYGQEIIETKSRVRGRGTSLSLRLSSPGGTACNVKGIAVLFTGNAL